MTVFEKLMDHVEVGDEGHTTPCWNWQRGLSRNGYARCMTDDRPRRCVYVHRVLYEERRGAIPTGADLDHLCRNRRCVNPDHLEPVTRAVNIQRGAGAKLTQEQAETIRTSPLSSRELAKQFAVSRWTVRSVRAGEVWSAS